MTERLKALVALRREIEQKLDEKDFLEEQKATYVLAKRVVDELNAIEKRYRRITT